MNTFYGKRSPNQNQLDREQTKRDDMREESWEETNSNFDYFHSLIVNFSLWFAKKKNEISESLKDFLLHQNASHNTAEQFCLCFSIRFNRVGILKKLWTSFLAKVKYQLYGS